MELFLKLRVGSASVHRQAPRMLLAGLVLTVAAGAVGADFSVRKAEAPYLVVARHGDVGIAVLQHQTENRIAPKKKRGAHSLCPSQDAALNR